MVLFDYFVLDFENRKTFKICIEYFRFFIDFVLFIDLWFWFIYREGVFIIFVIDVCCGKNCVNDFCCVLCVEVA